TAWDSARTAAGVACRFHDLRHTTVTRLLERRVPFATVAAIMGWSAGTSMRMAKRYSHIGQSAQREALALLDPKSAASPESKDRAPAPTGATLTRGRRCSDPWLNWV